MKKRHVFLIVVLAVFILIIVASLFFIFISNITSNDEAGDYEAGEGQVVEEEAKVFGDPSIPIRLASHEFIPVGDSRDIGNLGDILEVMQFGEDKIFLADNKVTCLSGGVACIRAKYREDIWQNEVQTKCIACVDETGSCKDEEKAIFDLQQFSNRPGNANWFESGENVFYGVCNVDGRVRLQQSPNLPKLYFQIVDALGSGAYSLGEEEYDWQRRGIIRTYSEEEIKPNWIIYLGQEIEDFSLVDGRVIIPALSCEKDPSCSSASELVRDGDIVKIGFGAPEPGSYLKERYTSRDFEVLLEKSGVGFEWGDIPNENKFIEARVIERLVSIQIFDQVLEYFNSINDFENRDVTVAYWVPWYSYTIGGGCPPDDNDYCDEVLESAIDGYESDIFTKWKNRGVNLWASLPMNYYEDNDGVVKYVSWEEDVGPDLSNFDGLIARFAAGPVPLSKDELNDFFPEMIADFSSEIKRNMPGKPVVLESGGTLTAFTEAVGCEADYCETDFKYSYLYSETAIKAVQENLGNQFAGVGVKLFEGAHFDIRNPVENKSGFELNRVGETGYNNPVLNIYTAR